MEHYSLDELLPYIELDEPAPVVVRTTHHGCHCTQKMKISHKFLQHIFLVCLGILQ